jgi:hypothetical protein
MANLDSLPPEVKSIIARMARDQDSRKKARVRAERGRTSMETVCTEAVVSEEPCLTPRLLLRLASVNRAWRKVCEEFIFDASDFYSSPSSF